MSTSSFLGPANVMFNGKGDIADVTKSRILRGEVIREAIKCSHQSLCKMGQEITVSSQEDGVTQEDHGQGVSDVYKLQGKETESPP